MRCKTGNRIHLEWSHKVNIASMETWEKIFSVGYLKYAKHAKKCKVCKGNKK